MSGALRRGWPAAVALVGLCAIWELVVRLSGVDPHVLPAPSEIALSAWSDRASLLQSTWTTVWEGVVGFVLGIAVALPFSASVAASRTLDRAVMPLLIISQAIPLIAIGPLFLIWFGFGALSKVLVVAVLAVFPIAVAAARGLRDADPAQQRMAASLGASRWWILVHVTGAGAAPSLFSGIRISAAYVLGSAATAEYLGSRGGLGIYLMAAQSGFRTDLVFAAAAVLTVGTLLLLWLVGVAERLLIPSTRRGMTQ